ncbi:MAG: hypothetical protein V1732_04850 [Patescibacteria group bacterium]|nr:hypothetical protein [Patescibacteria group bacterium]MBU4141667.1 hypothetical protein [Patescibacteria group bacterium]
MTREEEIKKIKDELSALYSKALVKEDYKKAVKLTGKYTVTLGASRESPDTIVSTILDGLWSEYYLLLKFPEIIEDEEVENNDNFVEKIEKLISHVVEPANKAELLYLASVTWSHLLNDQENAEWCNSELQKLISSGKVSVNLILKGINSRVIKEMGAKNWREAIVVADEINKFSEEVITHSGNLGTSANIRNNRGASMNRGKIDPVEGAIDLLQAAIYYSFQDKPAAKHFKGLPDRLRESLDNMLSKESVMGSPNKEIFALIEKARNILQPVSEQIEKGQASREYFEMLAISISDIREKIIKLKQ